MIYLSSGLNYSVKLASFPVHENMRAMISIVT